MFIFTLTLPVLCVCVCIQIDQDIDLNDIITLRNVYIHHHFSSFSYSIQTLTHTVVQTTSFLRPKSVLKILESFELSQEEMGNRLQE